MVLNWPERLPGNRQPLLHASSPLVEGFLIPRTSSGHPPPRPVNAGWSCSCAWWRNREKSPAETVENVLQFVAAGNDDSDADDPEIEEQTKIVEVAVEKGSLLFHLISSATRFRNNRPCGSVSRGFAGQPQPGCRSFFLPAPGARAWSNDSGNLGFSAPATAIQLFPRRNPLITAHNSDHSTGKSSFRMAQACFHSVHLRWARTNSGNRSMLMARF